MKKFCSACRTLDQVLAGLEIFVLTLCLLALILGEIIVAVLRTSSQMNLAWIEEILKYAVIWIGLLGASLASRSNDHISIEIVSKFSGPRTKRYLSSLTALATTIIVFYLALAGISYIQNERQEYYSSGGIQSSRYIALENLRIYRCSDELVQQRETWKSIQLRMLGDLNTLASLVQALPTKGENYELHKLANKTKENLAQVEDCDWSQKWIRRQWENEWLLEWQKYWQDKNTPQTIQVIAQTLPKRVEVEWQNRWISKFWADTGKDLVQAAWQQEGQQEWEKIADESDLEEEEFQEKWQQNWIETQWNEEWQLCMQLAWKTKGLEESCQAYERQNWLQKSWESRWKKQWQNTMEKHYEFSWEQGKCSICGKDKIGAPVTIPRWYLLLMLPISLFIIAWRFALFTIENIFVYQTPENQPQNATNL